MGKLDDLTGKQFGFLKVLYRVENDKTGHTRWMCKCRCGKEIPVYSQSLKEGVQLSCGCYMKNEVAQLRGFNSRLFNKYDLSGDYGIGYAHNNNATFYFDLEDYDKIKNYCWRQDKNLYIITNDHIDQRKIILLHRLVFDLNSKDDYEIDHIYHDPSDNRKQNLRVVKHCDNLKNRNVPKNNTSGVIGVSFDKNVNKWFAYITANKQVNRLGYYTDFDEAVKVRREAEDKYFGNFTNLTLR